MEETLPRRPRDDAAGYFDLVRGEMVVGALAAFAVVILGFIAFMSILWMQTGGGGESFPIWGAVWLLTYPAFIGAPVIALIGLPAAVWIEHRTPRTAGVLRRFGPYVALGLAIGALLASFVHQVALPLAVLAAVAGRAAAGAVRERSYRTAVQAASR